LRQIEKDVIAAAIEKAENEMHANGIVAVGDISNTLDTLAQKAKHNLAYYTFVELYDLDPTRANDKIIAGIEEPDAGRVTKSNSARIGILSQVDIAKADATVEEMKQACQAAQIWDLIDSLPNGL
jgi:hypothetical protein